MRHGSLFSGIGGFDLAAEWMGWENIFHCEIDPFCQSVLSYYWPEALMITDIKKFDFSIFKHKIDVLSGGWPCQKYSIAGAQTGEEPLKDAMVGVIDAIEPETLVLENVGNFISNKFAKEHDELCKQLERMGYEVQTFDIDAASCAVPTMERHIWIVAQTSTIGLQRNIEKEIQGQPLRKKEFPRGDQRDAGMWELSTNRVCDMGEGVPPGLSTETISAKKWHIESLKALGNAIPPEVAFQIFKAIQSSYETENTNA